MAALDRFEEWIDPGTFARVINGLESRLYGLGYKVEYGAEFRKLEDDLAETDKKALTEHFRMALNTYTPDTAFWVKVVDEDSRIIAVIAARVDQLGSQNLGEYIRNYWWRCYPDKMQNGVAAAPVQPRFLSEISGKVAYLGDLWVARDHQRKKIHEWLTPLTMFVALQKWHPDWIYCWVRPSAWNKRYPLAYGFSAVHPMGIQWLKGREPVTIDSDLVIGVNRRDWALDWLDRFGDEFPRASHMLLAEKAQNLNSTEE
ncbi:hypothetical protein [Roseibium algae]|uniref:GNAT family N-acetyltransferase n=1 Tax=Roseibium algae TaxID=3123038 RepID=A0ABU8TL74_9HYPH